MKRTYVYLVPGMFGFGKLAGYDYFAHIERALAQRFDDAGAPLHLEVIQTPPTASIALRAQVLAEQVARTSGGQQGPIYLLGHSTGGLDARLLVSPGTRLPLRPDALQWRSRVRGIVCMNTPHYGTPLAGYFTTVAGTRMLYALSLLTVTSLSLGKLPLTAFAGLVAGVGAVDEKLGINIHLLDQLTEYTLRIVGERGRGEMHDYLEHVRNDQGGIVHLMPEVMELFNAAVSDHPDVRYGCVATAAPAPGPRRVLGAVRNPFSAMSLAVYSTVYGVSSRADSRYPYARPDDRQRLKLQAGLGRVPTPATVDGIVPTLSMLWRELLWCGRADHLDVVGHFRDRRRPALHVDWLRSHAGFGRGEFHAMADAIATFMLA